MELTRVNHRDDDANGTSLAGHIDISYAELVERLGPSTETDGYKVDAEWLLRFEDGTVATIYNYKTGRNYLGSDGLAVEDIRDWHIGGVYGSHAVEAVYALFGRELT